MADTMLLTSTAAAALAMTWAIAAVQHGAVARPRVKSRPEKPAKLQTNLC